MQVVCCCLQEKADSTVQVDDFASLIQSPLPWSLTAWHGLHGLHPFTPFVQRCKQFMQYQQSCCLCTWTVRRCGSARRVPLPLLPHSHQSRIPYLCMQGIAPGV
jgi:hypothetical protein